MTQSHYSLRWNNHQTHILAAFDALLQAETLVDVTLVCAETSVRAHKVVLSACSPFFQRIFSENPCKHPVIVLKDFSGWEVQAIVDFMYKGEISVVQEQLQNLIKAAESLQVRGLANQDPFGVVKESILNQTPTPSASPTDYDRTYFPSPPPPDHHTIKLPRLSFPPSDAPLDCHSPHLLPRRKQARPRRRSGELMLAQPQDLSTSKPSLSPPPAPSPPPADIEETAENLCIKKPKLENDDFKEDRAASPPSPLDHPSPDLDVTRPEPKDFPSPINLQQPLLHPQHHSLGGAAPPTPLNMKQELDSHSPLPFPPMPSVSALAMTPPHSKFFGLDSPLGLFPGGLESCRNPLFELPDPRTTPDTQLFHKKKMGRPKGQHSAPRGGPPRSWTNAELTEALQHVWNKKMTTSQASRIFGIPYNSLLMYVRGKYGKSLKLEQLRKDCIAGPNPPLDLLQLPGGGNNNNNNKMPPSAAQDLDTRPASTEPQQAPPHHPVFNPFVHNFYPDFGGGFPIPVSMIHLLPQSEKSRDHFGPPPPNDGSSPEKKDLEDPHSPSPPELFRPVDDRRELLHNGQD